jgi:putative glutamine amidotransferase
VNSYHHQAVDEPGAGLAIVARAEDGTVEAVEDDQRRILGVQWHPEMHSGLDPVFTWFVEQARSGPYSPRRLMPSGA